MEQAIPRIEFPCSGYTYSISKIALFVALCEIYHITTSTAKEGWVNLSISGHKYLYFEHTQ